MISVKVNSTDADRQLAKLLRLPMASVNRQIGAEGVSLIQNLFIRQMSFRGQFWRGLSITTLHLRARKGSSSRLKLIDTGKMFSSTRAITSARGVELVNDAPGAIDQNFGNTHNRIFGKAIAPIPARPFMPSAEELPKSWIDRLRQPLVNAIDKASK